MQDELTGAGLDVVILGINEVGHESGNTTMTTGRDLPWLQETAEELVWDTWGITYRDVVVLDGENRVIAIYNVTEHNLSDTANYDELYGIFEAAASAP